MGRVGTIGVHPLGGTGDTAGNREARARKGKEAGQSGGNRGSYVACCMMGTRRSVVSTKYISARSRARGVSCERRQPQCTVVEPI